MGELIQLRVREETPKEDTKEVIDIRPKSLDNLIIMANDIALNSTDYVVRKANSSNIRFNESAGFTFITEDGDIKQLSTSRYALGQMCTKLGVPTRYIDKCVESGRLDLAQDNINSWLVDYNKDLLIREYDGGIRGVLSNKYSVCDSHEILKVVDDAVDLSKYKVKGSFLNEERLHVRLVGKEMLPISNEDLFAGLYIDSSDVGRSILTVKFGIYKQVCTNGLVIAKAGGTLFEQKHIGISADEFHKGLVASLSRVDELTEYAIDLIERARLKSNDILDFGDFRSLTPQDFENSINHIRGITNLSNESAGKVIDLMQTKYDSSRWGFINSITEVAQDFTLERRLELEHLAGNLLAS